MLRRSAIPDHKPEHLPYGQCRNFNTWNMIVSEFGFKLQSGVCPRQEYYLDNSMLRAQDLRARSACLMVWS
jgi:hypothetical protein